jgi:beta-glucosidase
MIGAPFINVLRHPAWGRAQESYGQDSYHLGEAATGGAFTASASSLTQRHGGEAASWF